MEGTEALRGAAARWSLAGDQQLLDLLQEIHQRIITKCNETNERLEEMSRGLRDASVNLQNVNNKFLALSNTQFVESRVYDDDTELDPPPVVKEPPKVKDLASDLSKLKESLQILESYHEPLLIVGDSDSDSDDNEDRLVLKPKDLYADRPLPYIIGSQAWRNKWHAGLVPDESDSDSSTSKVEEVEQYSDSEEERATQDYRSTAQDFVPARKVSSGNSSLQSVSPAAVSPARPSPAAVAAELARRLGGDIKVPEREPVYTQPETVVRKLYRPQEPLATTIFPDEPPPLEDQSSDDDIFAELHKTEPKRHSNTVDDLFDFNSKPSELEEALFGPQKVHSNQGIDKPLYTEDLEPEVIEEHESAAKERSDDSVKKPVGGISLFGTNQHAKSIGAAILKRNRRKSSTSGDESNTEEVKVLEEAKPVKDVPEVKKERDIFDDLFAKSEKLNKKNARTEVKTRDEVKAEVVKPKEVMKKDIFSDIFDDIDDIFSSDIVNVQVKETKKNETSLFSDDDDLFAEISKVKKDVGKDKVTASEKSDLFSDVPPKEEKVKCDEKPDLINVVPKVDKNYGNKENKVIKDIKKSKSLFDSDSDDGLFTNATKDVKKKISKTEKPVEYKLKDDLFDDDEDEGLFVKHIKPTAEVTVNTSKVTEGSKKALFDSDDQLFKNTEKFDEVKPNVSENSDIVNPDSEQLIKPKEVSDYPKVIDSINNDSFYDDVPSESQKESSPEASYDSFGDTKSYETDEITKNKTKEITDLTPDSENNKSNEKISEVFDKSNEEIIFSKNILRTTRIASDYDNVPPEPQAQDVFIDSDDDLFRSKPKTANISDKSNKKEETSKTTIVPQSPEVLARPNNKDDIFSDIFDDVPPVFEKPKEPKKSKNVNALFDDDSDDEALFFKKNDVVTDEKPDFSPSEERFGIFNDEPPAIDVDFTQKSIKKEENVQHSQKPVDIPRTLVKTGDSSPNPIKTDNYIEKAVENIDAIREGQDATDNTSKESKKIGKLKPMNLNINVNSLLPGASPKKRQVDINTKQEQTASNEELHQTGKVEPKMVKSISFDDPELLDNKISKERAKIQVKRRPSTRRARREAARKSAIDFTDSSFDSSNDNSTKEEVKEKIVKTVYILNDDDIFGTSQTNNENTEPTKKHLNIVDSDEELFKKPELNVYKHHINLTNENNPTTVERNSSVDSNDDNIFKTPTVMKDEIDIAKEIKNEEKGQLDANEKVGTLNDTHEKERQNESVIKASETRLFLDSDDGDDLFKQTNKKPSTANTINEPYIDSDEELFRNAPKTKIKQIVKETKPFSDSDDDDLFKTKNTKGNKPILKSNVSSDEDLFRNKGIGTLGKVYKTEDRNVKETHNIFNDFPAKLTTEDEWSLDVAENKVETVKENIEDKPLKDVKVRKSILDDLSDEEDLIKSKTVLINKKDKSLFGDDENGDDLFGTKSVKEVLSRAPAAPRAAPKAPEPVFADPLSLFRDED